MSLLLVATSSFAATVTKIDDAALAPLRAPRPMAKIRIDALPLEASTPSVIELEEFQVWAPDGKVIIHGEGGKILSIEDPTPMRFFRGLVNGDPESFAYFSVDQAGHVYGLVATREHKYAVTAQRRPARQRAGANGRDTSEYDHFLTEAADNDEIAPGQTWECVADRQKMTPADVGTKSIHAGTDTFTARPAALTGTQTYGITIEVETDYEFYTNAGSNSTTAQNYVTNLTGAVSTIYNRDLKTNVTQSAVNIYTNVSDPWSATDSSAGLDELGAYYHNATLKPAGRTTSDVVLLSGKAIGAGIAWEGVICGSDFSQGAQWVGPYAWCGGIGSLFGFTGLGSIPDPNGQNGSGVTYGMPSGTQNYWPLAEYAHEVGHNMGGHHTHCVPISSAEAATTNHPTQLFVDMCHTGEVDQYYNPFPTLVSSPCATGTNYSSAPTELGTIMSYCHNVFNGMGYPQSRFVFGVATEVSNHELTDFMLRAAGPLVQGGPRNIVSGTTATLSSITAPSSVTANSTGNVASVTNTGGQTYSWSIGGGSITAGGSTSSVTFTAGASGNVVVTVNAVNSTMCSVRDSKTIPITSALAAPTNVIATPQSLTSVLIQWTASAGATSYEVWRSGPTAFTTFTGPVCTATSSATSCTDTTALGGNAYLYKVRATAPSTSAYSLPDLATTLIFNTDPTLTSQTTSVKAQHIIDLRAAVTAVCALAATTCTYTTSTPVAGSSIIKAADINDLRGFITTARGVLGVGAPTFTTSSPVAGASIIQAADVADLRAAVK